MLIAICAELGVKEVFLIASVAANCAWCMLFWAVTVVG